MSDQIWKYKGTYYNVIVGKLLSTANDNIYTTVYECDEEGNIDDLHNFVRIEGDKPKQSLREMHAQKKPGERVSDPKKTKPNPKPVPESDSDSGSDSESETGCRIS